MRFLLARRWILFLLAVIVLAYGAWWLGEWQFYRLADRKEANSRITTNLRADPVPVADVLAVDQPVASGEEWRRVTATGTYVPDETVVVRYQTRQGAAGVDVVVPLRTDAGPALLVDRGWMATGSAGVADVDPPAPPDGEVRVTGFVRADGTGDSTQVTERSARAVSSITIGDTLPFEVYGGFVDLDTESPAPAQTLARTELPDLGNGPHFFYGLQWWFFGLLAVFGFLYLAWDERRKLRGGTGNDEPGRGTPQSERSIPPSTGSITPVTKDEAGESRNAAARPNSSGVP